jgi:[ribosomal protein S5]-alanine N-acetyltransferase
MDQIVILETPRLLLREFTLADVDGLEKVLGDPIAMEFYPAPFRTDEVRAWIERNMAGYQKEGFGLWAMMLKASGELIGDCGCWAQVVEGNKQIEVAYHVRRDHWGNGYATEAARSCMEYAFARLNVPRVISMIRPENYRSRRVAEKNGLVNEKTVFWHGYDHCIYVRQRR